METVWLTVTKFLSLLTVTKFLNRVKILSVDKEIKRE